jgi:hypothetical protein
VLRCALAWAKEEPAGAEFALATRTRRRLRAVGVAVHAHPRPYRLDYRLETAPGFATARLRVVARGAGWRRELVLARAPAGAWTIAAHAAGAVDLPPPGGAAAALAGAIDCDLGLSPLTNTLPVLRLGLLGYGGGGGGGGGPHELLVAWVSVPDLAVRPYAQRYTPRGADAGGRPVVRYEDADGGFAADLSFDTSGYVLHYPGLARRLDGRER